MAKKKMPTKKKVARQPRGYSRVDSDTTNSHGWLVRIRRQDVLKSSFVSDSTHGGKRKSLAAAIKLYQEWTAKMPPMETCAGKMSVRNASGVVGVHYANDGDSRYPNCSYESYIASWLGENGKRMKLGFSCNKYGEDAFALACIAREKKLTDREKVLAIFAKKGAPKSALAAAESTGAKKAAAKKVTSRKYTTENVLAKRSAAKKATAKKVAAKKVAAKKVTTKPTKKKLTKKKATKKK
jgi:hypothetical protein